MVLKGGRYDHGEELNEAFSEELKLLEEELSKFRFAVEVLELAAGTGWWTQHLLKAADFVTAIDASPEAGDHSVATSLRS